VTPSTSPQRILIVEDEYFIAADLAKVLKGSGLEVMGPAATLDDAGAVIAREGLPDAAILDVNVASILSFKLAEDLVDQHVPVMFVTGYDGWHLPDTFRKYPRITKPARPEQLLTILAEMMEDSHADPTQPVA